MKIKDRQRDKNMAGGGRVKRYPEEFKQTAVELALVEGTSVSQVARDLEMSEKTLHNWLRLHREKSGASVSKREDDGVEAELKRLRKENAQLKQERDILKKATALCAASFRASRKKLIEVRLDSKA
jgi:transposase